MGVKQWLFQRGSNAVFVLFGFYLLFTLLNGVGPATLDNALSGGVSRLFILVTLLLACLNAMLAGWQIAGDYAHKINVNDRVVTAVGVVVSLVYLVVGLQILF
ncbi:MAG: hypothetical protein HKO71_02305 [Pseudomonadales bacterium]|nr:hypothetical protein [Pseudomonadales bacterium]